MYITGKHSDKDIDLLFLKLHCAFLLRMCVCLLFNNIILPARSRTFLVTLSLFCGCRTIGTREKTFFYFAWRFAVLSNQ